MEYSMEEKYRLIKAHLKEGTSSASLLDAPSAATKTELPKFLGQLMSAC